MYYPIVHGTLSGFPEFCAHAALHAGQRPDHAFHGVIRHPDNDRVTGQPFGQDYQGRLAALAPHGAVHFPVAKRVPVVKEALI